MFGTLYNAACCLAGRCGFRLAETATAPHTFLTLHRPDRLQEEITNCKLTSEVALAGSRVERTTRLQFKFFGVARFDQDKTAQKSLRSKITVH